MTVSQESSLYIASSPGEFITAVPLAKAYRLLNHGPTVLVSAAHNGARNVMAAAWNMALNFEPAQVTVVLDRATWTRQLIAASGKFALSVPSLAIAAETLAVGRLSAHDLPAESRDKIAQFGLQTFIGKDVDLPLIEGCVAWLECDVVPEASTESRYDLFIGQVTAAWADARVFADGHWRYEADTPDALRTLHYVAGGTFMTIGNSVQVAPAAPRSVQD
ncbi:MAG: flavin reductase family protein [Burkholderiales bacterium]|nr:flavin reductase family protein [Burkholderiales bacterium]